jgi:conjugal transfer ATP-binding protein TraC
MLGKRLFPDRRGQHPPRSRELDAQAFVRGLRSVVDLIAPAAWEVHRSYLRVDDAYVRTLALVGYPRTVAAAWLAPLVGFGEPLDIALHLFPLESSAIIRTLTSRLVQHQSSRLLDAGEGRLADPAREIAFADNERLREALQRGDERIFSVAIYLTFRASSLPALDRLTQSVETTLAGMLAQSRRCTFEHEAGFRSTLPDARDYLGVRRNLDTSSVATAFPFTSATLVHPKGVLYGINLHDRSLVIVDAFDPELPNANCCVFAKSGMGKSFAIKLELLRSLVLGVDYVVIDPESEYARLSAAVGGQTVRFAASSADKINPFDLPPADDTAGNPLEEKLESLLTFLELLVADRAQPLHPAERATLHAALRQTYQRQGITAEPTTHHHPPPVLADLCQTLRETAAGGGLGERLERYASGALGHVFSARTNVALDRRLVVFDVRDLPDELRAVGMFLIADFVWSSVRRNRKPRRLVIDEAWTLAQTEVGGRFLASLARRARKYFLGLTTISQDVGDFLGSEQGRAVLQNSALTFLLRQDASALDRLAETLKLTQGERDYLGRCGKGQGLLCTPENRVAVEITAAPEEYRLITSDPRELETLEREQTSGPGLARRRPALAPSPEAHAW